MLVASLGPELGWLLKCLLLGMVGLASERRAGRFGARSRRGSKEVSSTDPPQECPS